jgi:hypothetical protein
MGSSKQSRSAQSGASATPAMSASGGGQDFGSNADMAGALDHGKDLTQGDAHSTSFWESFQGERGAEMHGGVEAFEQCKTELLDRAADLFEQRASGLDSPEDMGHLNVGTASASYDIPHGNGQTMTYHLRLGSHMYLDKVDKGTLWSEYDGAMKVGGTFTEVTETFGSRHNEVDVSLMDISTTGNDLTGIYHSEMIPGSFNITGPFR